MNPPPERTIDTTQTTSNNIPIASVPEPEENKNSKHTTVFENKDNTDDSSMTPPSPSLLERPDEQKNVSKGETANIPVDTDVNKQILFDAQLPLQCLPSNIQQGNDNLSSETESVVDDEKDISISDSSNTNEMDFESLNMDCQSTNLTIRPYQRKRTTSPPEDHETKRKTEKHKQKQRKKTDVKFPQ